MTANDMTRINEYLAENKRIDDRYTAAVKRNNKIARFFKSCAMLAFSLFLMAGSALFGLAVLVVIH